MNQWQPNPTGRRRMLKMLAGVPFLGLAAKTPAAGMTESNLQNPDRSGVNALLVSATTREGHASLEHAAPVLRELYGPRRRILLINFASLPDVRDSYAERMQRDFQRIAEGYTVDSLHRYRPEEAPGVIRKAEAFYVSGGNTFLLLRELYDRGVVDLLRERVYNGVPYAGASAGSNLGGLCIGTTNDFPITDIPTRRSLGLFNGVYNPHHPEPEEAEFGMRQWKIREFARYNPDQTVIGVTNAGMLRLQGNRVTLKGDGALAFVQAGDTASRLAPGESIEL